MSDIGERYSYAAEGLRLWSQFNTRHGPKHDCLICADVRVFLKREPLVPELARLAQRQRLERAS